MTKPHSTNERIPDGTLVPAANTMIERTGRCADSWTPNEQEEVKQMLGPVYSHIPAWKVGHQCINLRKSFKTRRVSGHPPGKRKPHSPEYVAYLRSPKWHAYRQTIIARSHGCCVVCGAAGTDVHHYTYERVGHEEPGDCVLLCRKDHTYADKRRCVENGELPDTERTSQIGLFT